MNIQGPAFGLIVIVVLMCCATVIMVAALAARYKQRELQHRERMAAIERGAALPVLEEPAPGPRPFNPRTLQLRGLVWLFVGIGIVVSLGAVTLFSEGDKPAYERVSSANFAKANGATDEQVRMILNDRRRDGPGPGIALIGLIPMGVGLAYLITWRSERRAG